MPWHDALSAADKLRLVDRYPGRSFDEIAILAKEHPRYGHLFHRYDVEVIRSAEGLHNSFLYEDEEFPQVQFSGDQQAFADLVAQVMLAPEEEQSPVFERQGRGEGERRSVFDQRVFNKAQVSLGSGLSIRKTAVAVGISRQKVELIDRWRSGVPGYRAEPGPNPGEVILYSPRESS